MGTILDTLTSFTRSSSGSFVDSDGLIKSVASNLPRFDYHPVTRAPLGVLIEEARTNLIFPSENFETGWTKQSTTTVPAAIIAPDGTLTASKVVATVNNSSHRITRQVVMSPSTQYTWSFFVKKSEYFIFTMLLFYEGVSYRSAHFNLNTKTCIDGNTALPGICGIQECGDGWFRCFVTATTTSASQNSYCDIRMSNLTTGWPSNSGSTWAGDDTSGLYTWGGQLEASANSPYPTSYIRTTSAAVDRNKDTILVNVSAFPYSAAGGTLYSEHELDAPVTGNAEVVTLWDGSSSNRIYLTRNASGNGATSLSSGGVSQLSTTANMGWPASGESFPVPGYTKHALAWSTDAAWAWNGAIVGSNPSISAPIGVTALYLGRVTVPRGHIKMFKYWPRRLANSELVALTT